MKIRKDVVSVIVNVICTVICAVFAGCRLSVGRLQVQDVSAELFTTNTLNFVER